MHIGLVHAIELIGLGLLIGAVSPTFGIGGGLLTVPLLILIYHMPTTTATATSLGVIIFVSLSGTLAYVRERRIDFRVGLLFILFAVPGSVAGGFVSNCLRSLSVRVDLLQIIFALTMLTVAGLRIASLVRSRREGAGVGSPSRNDGESASDAPGDRPAPASAAEGSPRRGRLLAAREFSDRRGVAFSYTPRLFPGLPIAFLGGFLGAMLGLGGGVIYVPILTALIGLPAGIATATSTFTILFANPFAVLVRFASIRWDIVLFLAIGVVVSATTVPRFLHRVRAAWLLAGFWTLAILASLRLLLKVAGVNM